jgi:2-desacetyl-2-hydroxyethyl bacteriochlorophyllide A dehydrogenase
MKILTLDKPGEFAYSEGPTPAGPGADEALVRVRRIGVCGTDLHAFTGKQPFFTYPRILGHELAVEIVALASPSASLKVGDVCSVEPYINCGSCIACTRGKPNCCARMRVIGVHIDGGMREFFSVPVRKLHPANALQPDQIALVETLAIGAHAVSRARITKGEDILVIGAGPIGLSVIQFAQAAGRVIAMDIDAGRLAFCKNKACVADTIQIQPDNPTAAVEQLQALTSGNMPTVVFDATGNPASMNGALRYLAPGGTLVFVGLFQGDLSFSDPEFHKRETTLLASRNALAEDFTRIIRDIEQGRIDTSVWITHRAAFADVAANFASWTKPQTGVLKAMIEL